MDRTVALFNALAASGKVETRRLEDSMAFTMPLLPTSRWADGAVWSICISNAKQPK